MTSTKETLLPHEWLAVLLILCSFIFLIFLGMQTQEDLRLDLSSEIPQTVVIKIEGAVQFPGKYHAFLGAKVQEIIQKAKPLAEADLKRVSEDLCVKKRMKIKIPKKRL